MSNVIQMPGPRPTLEQLTEEALVEWRNGVLAEFCDSLSTARGLWRRHRELIEAESLPERLVAAYAAEHEGQRPDDDMEVYGEDAFRGDEDFERDALRTARALAKTRSSCRF